MASGIYQPSWNIPTEIADILELQEWAVKNTVDLLEDDNTIPFIARYRKEKTASMEASTIREVKEALDELKNVKKKAETMLRSINKLGKLEEKLKNSFCSARSMSELEHLYAPFKTGSKRTLAERAKELGLENLALSVLNNPKSVDVQKYIDPVKEGLRSKEEVEKGIKHILADIIAKDPDILEAIRQSLQKFSAILESKQSRTGSTKSSAKTSKCPKEDGNGKIQSGKFELYYNFTIPVKHAKPHQVLAVNRGEKLKELTVKINIPHQVKEHLFFTVKKKYYTISNTYTWSLIKDSFEDCYIRLLQPLMVRHNRSKLTKTAEKASIEVFVSNLRKLLLTPPFRGNTILGIDPGFKNGCKWALISKSGKVLEHGVSNLHAYGYSGLKQLYSIKECLLRHKCQTIGIGNGTACRETEALISEEIKKGFFGHINLSYCIVNEDGASIYSASDVAKQELPDLDINVRSAVSIARRLLDPLPELVKIEPKHIGVGMYQHDLAESQLQASLNEVVEECVSFVGVDINVCSELLLRKVAGLNIARAKKIIEYRESHGPFICRDQLLEIKGLGPKSYKQCAGFIRVLPETSEDNGPSASQLVSADSRKRKLTTSHGKKGAKKSKSSLVANKLDQTCIHPEAYDIVDKFLSINKLDSQCIGQEELVSKVESIKSQKGVKKLADECDTGVYTMDLILSGLLQPLNYDIREEFEKPLFRKGLTSLDNVKEGTLLTGRVVNTTHFGAFVDAGIGINGLVHSSKMPAYLLKGKKTLELGDKVEVAVTNIDHSKKRVGLFLKKLF